MIVILPNYVRDAINEEIGGAFSRTDEIFNKSQEERENVWGMTFDALLHHYNDHGTIGSVELTPKEPER